MQGAGRGHSDADADMDTDAPLAAALASCTHHGGGPGVATWNKPAGRSRMMTDDRSPAQLGGGGTDPHYRRGVEGGGPELS